MRKAQLIIAFACVVFLIRVIEAFDRALHTPGKLRMVEAGVRFTMNSTADISIRNLDGNGTLIGNHGRLDGTDI